MRARAGERKNQRRCERVSNICGASASAILWNICGSFFSGICCCFGRFMEHLREIFRHLLLFWPFFGTFAGDFPAFVAVLAVFWNICGSFFSGICCCACRRAQKPALLWVNNIKYKRRGRIKNYGSKKCGNARHPRRSSRRRRFDRRLL